MRQKIAYIFLTFKLCESCYGLPTYLAANQRFVRDVAARIGDPALLDNPRFQQLCLLYFREESLGQVEARWRGLDAPAG